MRVYEIFNNSENPEASQSTSSIYRDSDPGKNMKANPYLQDFKSIYRKSGRTEKSLATK
jgi:hypothetical protein